MNSLFGKSGIVHFYDAVFREKPEAFSHFVGLLGNQNKHMVLAQNSFQYADCLYDLDYTATPLSWAVNVVVIERGHFLPQVATRLVNSF